MLLCFVQARLQPASAIQIPVNRPSEYVGRFAPSPTGPVHFGTLLAAVGSYLQAKTHDGKWLVRIEDVDITRSIEGSDRDILDTLEKFGFEWDDEIVYQSQRTGLYEHALDTLIDKSLIYPCRCSRKQLADNGSDIYPGTCRHLHLPDAGEHALRVMAEDRDISFTDQVMGEQHQNIARDCGDFVVRRRDQLFAYQLAVVVDDASQGITEIVRGADLLDSTPRQIYLQQQLGYTTPSYCHLPLAVDNEGRKISKSAGHARIDLECKQSMLCKALDFLGQRPPPELADDTLADVWRWAIMHWDHQHIPTVMKARFD